MVRARKLREDEIEKVNIPEEPVVGIEIEPMVQEAPVVKEQPKVREQSDKVLKIRLGSSLKEGDVLTDKQYKDLIGAGFTDEQLFGN